MNTTFTKILIPKTGVPAVILICLLFIGINPIVSADKSELIAAVQSLKAACLKPETREKAALQIAYIGPDKERRYLTPVNYALDEDRRVVEGICQRINAKIGEIQSYGEVMTQQKKQQSWFAIEFSHRKGDKEKKNIFAFLEINGKLYLGDID